MADSLAAVCLAAGLGTRLLPLTRLRPKPLCPVNNVPLLDLAIERVLPAVGGAEAVAVNAHAKPDAMRDHLARRWPGVHLSVEQAVPLGTAGAIGRLKAWVDGRDVLVVNADAWCPGDLAHHVADWDRERVRLVLVGGGPFGPGVPVAGALLPWAAIEQLSDEPTGLYPLVWRPADLAGRLEAVAHPGPFVDCGTPADYLRANLLAAGGKSVIGQGAAVMGTVERCVVWPGATVERPEHLVDAIRADERVTVLVR